MASWQPVHDDEDINQMPMMVKIKMGMIKNQLLQGGAYNGRMGIEMVVIMIRRTDKFGNQLATQVQNYDFDSAELLAKLKISCNWSGPFGQTTSFWSSWWQVEVVRVGNWWQFNETDEKMRSSGLAKMSGNRSCQFGQKTRLRRVWSLASYILKTSFDAHYHFDNFVSSTAQSLN